MKPTGWRPRPATAPARPDGGPPRQISCGRKRMMQQVTAGQRLRLTPPRPAGPLRTRDATSSVLHKNELQRLAGDLKIDGHATMTKPDLIQAIGRKRGLHLDALTKGELLRIGRDKGSEVRASMTKDQLIGVVRTSEAPARRTHANAGEDKR